MSQINPVHRVQNKKARIQGQIESLQKKMTALDAEEIYATQLTELCPDCKGSARERYTDAAGSGDWRECSTCKGWGYISKELICPECKRKLDDMTYLRRQNMPYCPFCGAPLWRLFKTVVD